MARRARSFVLALIIGGLFAGTIALPASAVEPEHSVVVNPNPVNNTPHVVDGRIYAIIQVGNKMIAGGSFTNVQQTANSANIARSRIFAFDATTGVIDPNFAPDIDGDVYSLVATPDGHIIAGGTFSNVNGVASQKLAKLDLSNGQQVTTFKARADGRVKDMALRNGKLYIAGSFSLVNNIARDNLAAVNPDTGALDPNFVIRVTQSRDGVLPPTIYAMEADPAGTKLMIIGNFTNVGGQSHWQAAMIDITTSPETVADWHTDRYGSSAPCSTSFDTYMRDVAFSPDGSYFAIVTTGAYRPGQLCDAAARWESNATGTNLQPTWVDYTGGDTLYSVAITGTAVYLGGHQRFSNNPYVGDRPGPGAVERTGITALNPDTGLAYSWNPTRDRGVGVFVLYPTEQGLWLGSDTDVVAGETHRKLALFPLAGGTAVPENEQIGLPNDLYNMPTSGAQPGAIDFLGRRFLTGTGPQASSTVSTPGFDWGEARGAFVNNGVLYVGRQDGRMFAHSFDGQTVGQTVVVDLHGLTTQYFNVPSITGMFFDGTRLFYTVAGDGRMHWRYFLPESRLVGAFDFTINGDWANVAGMTMADGKIYFARTNGNLYSVDFANAAPVPNTEVLVSPASDGYDWASRAMFVYHQSPDTAVPSQPGQPTGSSNSTSTIDLTWTASTDDRDGTVTYRVYRDGGTAEVGVTTAASFTDTGLVAGSTHTYTVEAEDAAGNDSELSDPSEQITVQSPDTMAPSQPGQPTGSSNSTSTIDLTWTASTDDRDGEITYRVYRDGEATPATETTGRSFTDTGLVAGSTHTYTVEAEDAAGNDSELSDPSEQITVQSPDTMAPSQPGQPTGSSNSTSTIDLTWTASDDDRGGTVTYRVFRDGGTEVGVTTAASFQDTGLVAGSTHTYTVEAEDAAGNESELSDTSEQITVQEPDTTEPAQPAAPTGVSNTINSIDVTWTAVDDDRGGEITYRLYRDGGASPVIETTSLLFTDTDLVAGSTHTYTVEAADEAGNVSELSDPSEQTTVQSPDTTAPLKPGKPTGTSTTTSSINVSWPATTDNGGGTITYRLYRDGGTLVTETAGTTTFSDTGLVAGSAHTYRVAAKDAAGNESGLSDSSASIKVQSPSPVIFSDNFSSRNLSKWAVTGKLAIDTTRGKPTPSARGTANKSKAIGTVILPSTQSSLCMSSAIRVQSVPANTDLLRLRTAGNGAVVKVYVAANRRLWIKSDVSGKQVQTSATLPLNGWATVELCGNVGAAGKWDLAVNGTIVKNNWVANTGTSGIGRVQIGDSVNKTWTINWDNVVVEIP